MADYIDREKIFSIWRSMPAPASVTSLAAAISQTPAADVVEVRHGRWLDKGWDGDFSWQIDGRGSCWRVYECSECQCKTSAKTDYCPNCGARMGKEDDHD